VPIVPAPSTITVRRSTRTTVRPPIGGRPLFECTLPRFILG
jgi:hypothetical protein